MMRRAMLPALVRIGLILFAVWAVLLAGPGPASAGAGTGRPQEIKVGLQLMNLSKLDTTTGTFKADFFLTMTCDRPCDFGDFELMNGESVIKTPSVTKPDYRDFRVQGTLIQTLDFHAYPFDQHDLSIMVEDKDRNTAEVVYTVDLESSEIDPAVSLTGWNVNHALTPPAVTEKYYKLFNSPWSRYTFNVTISRPVLSVILKGLFPALILVISGFLSLIMGPDKALQRLGVNTSALVATVLFHLNLTNGVPQVPYLTWADWFMIINYLALGAALAATVALARLHDTGREALALQMHHLTGVLVPSLWALAHAANLLLIPSLHIPQGWTLVPAAAALVLTLVVIMRRRRPETTETKEAA